MQHRLRQRKGHCRLAAQPKPKTRPHQRYTQKVLTPLVS